MVGMAKLWIHLLFELIENKQYKKTTLYSVVFIFKLMPVLNLLLNHQHLPLQHSIEPNHQ